MSGVVLRCPSCGTTKAAPGECDACHEAEVRYYCTNHTPGRWLDSSTCPQCGSQFGVPERRPAAPPSPPARPRRPAPAPVAPAPTPSPAPTRPKRRYTPWPPGGPWDRRPAPDEETEARLRRDPFRDALARRLPDLLTEAARARRSAEAPDMPPVGMAAAGCLRAVLLIALFFMLALFGLSMILGGAMIQLMGQ
jgi:hypothetical protein